MKKQLSLVTLWILGVGWGYAQPFRPAQIEAQVACHEGNLSIKLQIIAKDSIQAQPGTLNRLNDSSYVLRDVAAGQMILIRQITPTQTLEISYLVPEIEPGPVLPPMVSESVMCEEGTPVVLQAVVPEGQTVDWYDAPVGGTLLAADRLELTVSHTGSYYAESRIPGLSCLRSSRVRTAGVVRLSKSLCPTVLVSRIAHQRVY